MMFNVLIEWHPMVGVDLHAEITSTVPPAPAPMAPHLTAATLNWIIPAAMTRADRPPRTAAGFFCAFSRA